jgi:hypothetical protein
MRRDAQVAAVEELLVADGDGYPLAEAEAEGEADAEVVTEASDDGWADITVWTDAPDVVGPQAAAPFQLLPPLRKPRGQRCKTGRRRRIRFSHVGRRFHSVPDD